MSDHAPFPSTNCHGQKPSWMMAAACREWGTSFFNDKTETTSLKQMKKFPVWVWNLRTPAADADPQACLLKANDLWQHSQSMFSCNRDFFISDKSPSEDESVQDDIPISLLVFTKSGISHCSFLFSTVSGTMTIPPHMCSHILFVLQLSEFILLLVFTE